MVGFLTLAFNPHAWAVVGIAFIIGFSGGVVKGWNASNADQWRQAAVEAKKAAEAKERLSEADRRRAEVAESEAARRDATLESFIHETKASPHKCIPDPVELKRLRVIAASGR
jgi:hypothetical protein